MKEKHFLRLKNFKLRRESTLYTYLTDITKWDIEINTLCCLFHSVNSRP